MSKRSFLFCLAAALLFSAGAARAHGVSMSAIVAGGEIVVDCAFGHDHKLSGGDVSATDSVSGEVIFRGLTDDDGRTAFRPAAEFLSKGHGIKVSVTTADGHHAEREISSAELRGLSGLAGQSSVGQSSAGLDAAGLEAALTRVIEAQLLPIRQDLARAQAGPGMTEIIGGLGWIAGLFGVAAYLKSRPDRK